MSEPKRHIGTVLIPTLIGMAILLAIAAAQHIYISHVKIAPRNFVVPLLVGAIAGFSIGLHNRRLLQRGEKLQEALDEVWRTAYYDQLTGLPNRAMFVDRLNHALAGARRTGGQLAVVMLDIDRFLRVNESLGHSLGDRLLRIIAERIAASLRQSDTVARLGGDEFILLVSGISTPDDAALVASKVLDVVARPIELEGFQLSCSCSIGIVLTPLDGDDAETILKNADSAMYTAKEAGGNNYRFYSWYMNQQAVERLAMEGNMQLGLERGDFQLFYQPQIDLKTGRLAGVEALLRWHTPGVGAVSPGLFIPLAEETGFIIPLGEWVLKTACEQAMAWGRAGLPPLKVAVNLSVRQFRQKNLVRMVAGTLEATGMPPELLELELTESCFVERPDEAVAVLSELKALGVKLAIDDFGTGYSSLAYLKLFPIDHLKIALPFVRDITTNPGDAAIAEAIIVMSKTMGIKVIAEGVETPDQRLFLEMKNCDIAQGFLFARPVPAEALTRLLAMNESQRAQALETGYTGS